MARLLRTSFTWHTGITLLSLTGVCAIAGCSDVPEPPDNEERPDHPNADGCYYPGDGDGDGYDEGTGGGDPGCTVDTVVKQAFVCAGYINEERNVSQRLVNLQPAGRDYACSTEGTALTPYADEGEGPPMPGDGPEYYPDFPAAGGSDGYGPSYPDEGTGGMDSWDEEEWGYGGYAMGGAGGYGSGGYGVGGGDPYPPEESWCSEAPEGTAIAGVTYSVDACNETELRLPIRIQEPGSWYRVKVYHGATPCERGDLLADISGQGTGEVIELPVVQPTEGYVSIEYTTDADYAYPEYYYYGYDYPSYGHYGETLQVELNPISGGLLDGE